MKIKKFNEKTKVDYFVIGLSAFLKNVDRKIVENYINDPDTYEKLGDYIGLNLKPEFEWVTALGIIEAVELIINDASENTNIKI